MTRKINSLSFCDLFVSFWFGLVFFCLIGFLFASFDLFNRESKDMKWVCAEDLGGTGEREGR